MTHDDMHVSQSFVIGIVSTITNYINLCWRTLLDRLIKMCEYDTNTPCQLTVVQCVACCYPFQQNACRFLCFCVQSLHKKPCLLYPSLYMFNSM